MSMIARVARVVKAPAVRLIFDSAEMGCDLPKPFGDGILATRYGVVRRPRRFEPSEADKAWWAAESARIAEDRELAERAARAEALSRLERGCCL